jgi:hypothetical protein
MAETVRETMREMLLATLDTMDELLAAGDADLKTHSTHVCGHEEDAWRLITNLIDHETQHMAQVIQGRYEARDMRSPMERLVSEWLEVRARFLGTLVGMSDQQFNGAMEEGEWSYRQAAEHLAGLELHALRTMASDRENTLAGQRPD